MTDKLLTVFATVFALLGLTAPAHAVMVEGSFNGIVTSGGTVGDSVSGTLSYDSAQLTYAYPALGRGYIWPLGAISYSFNLDGSTTTGSYNALSILNNSGPPNNFTFTVGNSIDFSFGPTDPTPGLQFTSTNIATSIYSPTLNTAQLAFSDINLNGIGNINGINFELNSFDISPVSLPPALPMFGVVLFALGAFAWRRKVAG